MKNNIFFDVTPCNPIEVHLSFREKYCLHLQGRNFSQEIQQQEVGNNKTKQQSSASRTHNPVIISIVENNIKHRSQQVLKCTVLSRR
jgi:hypothetical protein